jgi:hypothetical protein
MMPDAQVYAGTMEALEKNQREKVIVHIMLI